MQVKRVYNYTVAKEILSHPAIWSAISNDYVDPDSFTLVDKRSYYYLIGTVDSVPIGLGIAHPNLRKEYFIHFHVLPRYRKEYSAMFAREGFNWMWNNTDINTLYTVIPETFPHVISFAEVSGFKKKQYLSEKEKDNSIIGKWLMDIHRPKHIKKGKKK